MAASQPTQQSLLLRIRDERDAESWSRFVAIYSPLVYGFLRKRGLQDADAADLTQDVLARVASAIKGFEYDPRKGTFRGWLFTIVQNSLRKFVARPQPGGRGSGDTQALQALLQVPADAGDDEWDRNYQRHLLHRAAEEVRGEFQDATWQAFWGTAVDGTSPGAVASELGMSVAAVYMARHRVTARLRMQIEFLEGGLT
jgi:RNA polymerase sigma-70 factor (ECF subfamily)